MKELPKTATEMMEHYKKMALLAGPTRLEDPGEAEDEMAVWVGAALVEQLARIADELRALNQYGIGISKGD